MSPISPSLTSPPLGNSCPVEPQPVEPKDETQRQLREALFALKRATDQLKIQSAECDQLRAQNAQLRHGFIAAQGTITRQDDELARLEDALQTLQKRTSECVSGGEEVPSPTADQQMFDEMTGGATQPMPLPEGFVLLRPIAPRLGAFGPRLSMPGATVPGRN